MGPSQVCACSFACFVFVPFVATWPSPALPRLSPRWCVASHFGSDGETPGICVAYRRMQK